jgi:hypothetical protein
MLTQAWLSLPCPPRRISSLPPWRPRAVNGRVSLLLQAPPAELDDGSDEAAAAAQPRPVVTQGGFTRTVHPAASLPSWTDERLELVVADRGQVLRLLLSHKKRMDRPGEPMGWDRPLGCLDIPLAGLLEAAAAAEAAAATRAADAAAATAAAAEDGGVQLHASPPGEGQQGWGKAENGEEVRPETEEVAEAAQTAANILRAVAAAADGPARSAAEAAAQVAAASAAAAAAAAEDAQHTAALRPLSCWEQVFEVPATSKRSMAELVNSVDSEAAAAADEEGAAGDDASDGGGQPGGGWLPWLGAGSLSEVDLDYYQYTCRVRYWRGSACLAVFPLPAAGHCSFSPGRPAANPVWPDTLHQLHTPPPPPSLPSQPNLRCPLAQAETAGKVRLRFTWHPAARRPPPADEPPLEEGLGSDASDAGELVTAPGTPQAADAQPAVEAEQEEQQAQAAGLGLEESADSGHSAQGRVRSCPCCGSRTCRTAHAVPSVPAALAALRSPSLTASLDAAAAAAAADGCVRGVLAVYIDRSKQVFGSLPSRPTLAASLHSLGVGGGRRQVSMRALAGRRRGLLSWRQLFYLPVALPVGDTQASCCQLAAAAGYDVEKDGASAVNIRSVRSISSTQPVTTYCRPAGRH